MVEKNESNNFERFSCAIIEKRQILDGALMARLRRYGKSVKEE